MRNDRNTLCECFRNEGGNNNLYENLAMHDGMAIGFYLTKGQNNLVLNCDAYNNYDDFSEGAKGGNVDGFDLINASAQVVIDNCWSFYNGYQTATFESAGDGNGFKVGGIKPACKVRHGLYLQPRYPGRHNDVR